MYLDFYAHSSAQSRLRGRGGGRVLETIHPAWVPPPCPSAASGGGYAVALSVLVRPGSHLIHADAGRLDGGAPLLDLALDELLQILRRAAVGGNQRDPELVHAFRQRRRVHHLHRRRIELLDDVRRRALGQEETV